MSGNVGHAGASRRTAFRRIQLLTMSAGWAVDSAIVCSLSLLLATPSAFATPPSAPEPTRQLAEVFVSPGDSTSIRDNVRDESRQHTEALTGPLQLAQVPLTNPQHTANTTVGTYQLYNKLVAGHLGRFDLELALATRSCNRERYRNILSEIEDMLGALPPFQPGTRRVLTGSYAKAINPDYSRCSSDLSEASGIRRVDGSFRGGFSDCVGG